ncbi:MAG TPA: IS110 family transposase [Kofleriaceae bacterium]
MKNVTRYAGFDVHADTIAVAVAEGGRDGEVCQLGIIPNRPEAVRKLVQKLGAKGLQVCYEAGPTGYALYWQLVELGVACEVVAPTLVPVKAGDRVKTDRRDAVKLARCLRAGELTAVWVPDPAHEALRDLVRARASAKKDQLRARHRLSKFVLRYGRRPSKATQAWGTKHMEWMRALRFEHAPQQVTMVDYLGEVDHVAARIERLERAIDDAIAAAPPALRELIHGLQALRGVAKMTATTLAVEIGQFSRFDRPPKLMAYCGVVPGVVRRQRLHLFLEEAPRALFGRRRRLHRRRLRGRLRAVGLRGGARGEHAGEGDGGKADRSGVEHGEPHRCLGAVFAYTA